MKLFYSLKPTTRFDNLAHSGIGCLDSLVIKLLIMTLPWELVLHGVRCESVPYCLNTSYNGSTFVIKQDQVLL